MKTMPAASPTQPLESGARRASRVEPSPPQEGTRWWFVFDKWLAVPEVARAQDEFVMA